jgi:hypothetical protein
LGNLAIQGVAAGAIDGVWGRRRNDQFSAAVEEVTFANLNFTQEAPRENKEIVGVRAGFGF